MRRKRRRITTNIHHRKPISLGGTNHPNNLVRVSKIAHMHWHSLFGALPIEEIVKLLNDTWLDPTYVLVCVKTEEYYAALRELESTKGEVSHLQLVSSTNSHG